MLSLERKLELWAICGYEPFKEQLEAHASPARMKVVVGGERAGKSRWTGAEITGRLAPDPAAIIARQPERIRIAVAAESYDESHKEFEYVIEDLRKLGLLKGEPSTPKQGKWIVETNAHGFVESVSMKDGGKELTTRGEPYDMVVVVEAGNVRQPCYTDALLRVAETRGQVILSGTMWEEFGWYPELWQILRGPNLFEGRSFSIPTWANRKIFPGGRTDPEILRLEAIMPEEEFMRRLGAVLLPSPARIYRRFDLGDEGHVLDGDLFDPDLPVDLTVDAGYFPSKYAALPIQAHLSDLADHDPDETDEQREARADMREILFVIDEVWEQNLVHQQVIELCQERPWWPNVVRVWVGHEGKQHAAAESAEEVWRRITGLPVTVCRKLVHKYDGFMRVQTLLDDPRSRKPRLYVAKKCQGLIHEFTHYERRTNRFHEVVSDNPPDDAEDDALDALTNYVVDQYGLADRRALMSRPGRRSVPARG